MIEITLKRNPSQYQTTIGQLKHPFIKKVFTLEDEVRDKKIKGITAIPQGKYEIIQRKVLSGLTEKYRSKFTWFRWHLMLKDVPNFKYCYIHIGNYHKNTDGCILVGYKATDRSILNSTDAFKDLYFYITGALMMGEKVFINIINK